MRKNYLLKVGDELAEQLQCQVVDLTIRNEDMKSELDEIKKNNPIDDRPCSTDEFLYVLTEYCDDFFDIGEAVSHWLNKDWDKSLNCLYKIPEHWKVVNNE